MRIFTFIFILLAAFLSLQACNIESQSNYKAGSADQSANQSAIVDDDILDFMNKAASGAMMEVQLGEMAEQNSKSDGVKNFGIMMVKEHTRANGDLQNLAKQKDIVLPAVVSEEHQKHINELTPLRGPEFDEKYMDMMVNDHQADISLFQKAVNFNDPDISAFAAKMLPVLEKHLKAAKKIERNLTM